jgi:hypothetical protein
MQVIFLDIDSVLNTEKTRRKWGRDNISLSRLALLHQLVKDTGARVVLSSAWREWFDRDEMSKRLQLPVLDYTPVHDGDHRGGEIAAWLLDHVVDRFVILDDRDDMEPNRRWLIQTTDTHGLTERHCERARRLLNE